jgi:tetratricopeptide (TPR) repeat protein
MRKPLKKELPKKRLPQTDHPKQYQKPIKQVKKKRYSDLVGLGIIILLGIIIYSNSFYCSFHFDDLLRIVDNPGIRNLSDMKAWWNIYPSRPFGIFTFALNYHFNQLDVRYYHLVNLTIHLINACLAGWLTLLIFSSPALKDNPIASQKKVIAFITALMFVSHPLATQSVTYIVQRLTSLAALFYLLSLALYVKARLSNKGNKSKALLFTGSLISAVLAMLTKENAFTLPFAIVLFEFFFLRTKKLSINFRNYRMILVLITFLGFILIILLKFSFSIFKPIPPMLGHTYTITPFNYFFTQFSVIIKYLQLLFLPINQNLDYDFPISNTFFEIRTLLSFLVLLSLIILAVISFKRYRIISIGIFWFFLTLSIESSFIPINDVIFEHRTYLPSFGFFLILTSGIYYLLWNKHKYLAITIFVIIIGSNSYLTHERNKVWKDNVSLWSDVVSKSPNLSRALVNCGLAYSNIEQWDKAIEDYSKAIGFNTKYTDAYYNRGVAYANLGKWEQAIDDCSKAIEIDPKHTKSYYNRGVAYANLNQWDKAIDNFSKAIEFDTKLIDAYYNRGVAYAHLQQLDKAIADYSKVTEIDPKHTGAYSNRGIIYCNLGQWEKAIADYSKVIGIDPNNTDAYSNRGVAYATLGQLEKAITDFSKVIEIEPKNTGAYSNRGVAYGNLGKWDKAIADYSMAIEIAPNYRDAYYNRGIAYGNLEQWDNAIADYSKALEIDPNYSTAYSHREFAYRKLHSKKR